MAGKEFFSSAYARKVSRTDISHSADNVCCPIAFSMTSVCVTCCFADFSFFHSAIWQQHPVHELVHGSQELFCWYLFFAEMHPAVHLISKVYLNHKMCAPHLPFLYQAIHVPFLHQALCSLQHFWQWSIYHHLNFSIVLLYHFSRLLLGIWSL